VSKTKRGKSLKGDVNNESKLVLDFYLNGNTLPTLSVVVGQRGCLTGFEKTNILAENKILSPQDRFNFREFCIAFVDRIDKLKHNNNFWLKEIAHSKDKAYINEALKQTIIQRKDNLELDNDND